MSSVAQRRLCQLLGLLWLFDGVLQLQPYMWGPGFFYDLIGMANMGLPHPVEQLDLRLTVLLSAHPLPWDLLFSGIQIAIGLGLLTSRFRRAALAASMAWGLGVWVVGEGLGGLFMPGTSMLNGAPGPVLLYVVAAVLLWPADWPRRRRAMLALSCWSTLWVGTALLELGGANHAGGVPAAEIGDGAELSPWPVGHLQQLIGHLLEGRGAAYAAAAGLLGAAIGLLVWIGPARRLVLVAASALSLLYWALGQDLGALSSGRSTDPGAGPLWILLAALVWTATAGGDPVSTDVPTSLRRQASEGDLPGTGALAPAS